MRRPSNVMVASFLVLSAAALGCGGGGGGADCTTLTNYTATVTTPPSFATDIYPILSSTSLTGGCSQTLICHGKPPISLTPLNAPEQKTLRFLISTDPAGDPGPATMADVKAELLMASVNAPSMMRVVPSDVGASLMAYKISGKGLLMCADSMCVAGASASNMTTTCGDPMPSSGVITDADRTKILDWIKLGALD